MNTNVSVRFKSTCFQCSYSIGTLATSRNKKATSFRVRRRVFLAAAKNITLVGRRDGAIIAIAIHARSGFGVAVVLSRNLRTRVHSRCDLRLSNSS
mgnify:FL=1